MPSIKDKSTVDAIAVEFTSNGRNKEQALKTMGYAESTYKSGRGCKDVYGNTRVKTAIAKIDAKTIAKAEYERTESMIRKEELFVAIKVKALAGNLDAIRTAAGLLTNMDTICGLIKTHVVQEQAEERALSERERVLADRIAKLTLAS